MSTQSQRTAQPAIVLPTAQETAEALGNIARGRDIDAAVILRDFCLAIIKTVTEMDNQHNISSVLTSLELECHGPGNFRLNVVDKQTMDADAVVRSVADALRDANDNDYYKRKRAIQMAFSQEHEDNRHGAAAGLDGVVVKPISRGAESQGDSPDSAGD